MEEIQRGNDRADTVANQGAVNNVNQKSSIGCPLHLGQYFLSLLSQTRKGESLGQESSWS